jgi:hypothetical protein
MFVGMVSKEFRGAHERPILNVFQFKEILKKHHNVQIITKIVIHGILSPSYNELYCEFKGFKPIHHKF